MHVDFSDLTQRFLRKKGEKKKRREKRKRKPPASLRLGTPSLSSELPKNGGEKIKRYHLPFWHLPPSPLPECSL